MGRTQALHRGSLWVVTIPTNVELGTVKLSASDVLPSYYSYTKDVPATDAFNRKLSQYHQGPYHPFHVGFIDRFALASLRIFQGSCISNSRSCSQRSTITRVSIEMLVSHAWYLARTARPQPNFIQGLLC